MRWRALRRYLLAGAKEYGLWGLILLLALLAAVLSIYYISPKGRKW